MSRWRRALLLVPILATLTCRSRHALNVVLVTFDTTRADAFGVGATPAVDKLARDGIVFTQASTAAPLTLPSHASLLTGTFPPYHGIRENGSRALSPRLTTLAQLLHDHGYRTGAFVGAYVVDARWGLNHGFDVYSGSFDPSSADALSIGDLRRTADRVADDALSWLRQRSEKPFFMWVHFFDPHSPYDPPLAFAQKFPRDPYLAEIAFADSQLARIVDAVPDDTLFIIAGDHGEGFGEHGERGHGLLLYEETLHVPLVMSGRGLPGSVRVPTPVSLVDVFPSVTDLLGIPTPPQVQGHTLIPLLHGKHQHGTPIYAETMYPRMRFGWSELRVMRTGATKLIDSSEPELYDLASDPAEKRDLAGDAESLRDARRRLQAVAIALGKDAPPLDTRPVDAEARSRLASLGYLTSGAAPAQSGPLPSPRRKLAKLDALNRGRELTATGDFTGAKTVLDQLVRDEPQMIEARVVLGQLYLRMRRPELAVEAFTAANERSGDDPALRSALAAALIESGRADDALNFLHAAMISALNEPRYHYLAGRAWMAKGQLAEAKKEFDAALQINPRSSAALVSLGELAIAERNPVLAQQLASRALAIDARAHGARLVLAEACELSGNLAEAWQQASVEQENSRDDFRPPLYLAELAPKLRRENEIEPNLRRAMQLEPRAVTPYLLLAKQLLKSNSRFEEAIALTRKALQLKPQPHDEALSYFLLADLYNRVGRDDLSRENARRGETVAHRK